MSHPRVIVIVISGSSGDFIASDIVASYLRGVYGSLGVTTIKINIINTSNVLLDNVTRST